MRRRTKQRTFVEKVCQLKDVKLSIELCIRFQQGGRGRVGMARVKMLGAREQQNKSGLLR
jgi:hypothetical protein